MGKIRKMSTDYAWKLHDVLQSEAQRKFIEKVMKWEEVDWTMAMAICTGCTDPKEPEYTLGFKMADPLIEMAMYAQVGKKARVQAIENFKQQLDPEELELFEKEVETMNMSSKFKSALKREKKNKKC